MVTKCWPLETRLLCDDQWKAEKSGAFLPWPITRCFTKRDGAGLIIEHSINFCPDGQCNCSNQHKMDGWMTCDFTSFLTVFQSYQDVVGMIMRGCVQWNSVYGWEDFNLSEDRTRSARSVGQGLTHWATGAPKSTQELIFMLPKG